MVLTVYNIKGGVGKTTLAIQLAKEFNLNYITNDADGGAVELFENGKYVKDENKEMPVIENSLYDLGGFRTNLNIVNVLKNSKYVIIPTLISRGDVKSTLKLLNELNNINKNILIVINKVKSIDKKDDFKKQKAFVKFIKTEVLKNGLELNLRFAILRENNFLVDATYNANSIKDITNKLKRYIYRNVIEDVEQIKKIIKGV